MPIVVPALRERRGDVVLLAELFLERSAARTGVRMPRLGARALAALKGHSWPGNVRELENVMEAAVLLCRDGEVDVDHLPGIGFGPTTTDVSSSDLADSVSRLMMTYAPPDAAQLPPLREARDAFERAYLDALLQHTNGNVTSAAKTAGRNRTDFYDLLRRHGRSPRE